MEIEESLSKFTELANGYKLDALNPAATDEQLNILKRRIGFLPFQIYTLLKYFNGENRNNIEPMNGRAYFLSADEIVWHINLFSSMLDEPCKFPEDHPSGVRKVLYDKHWVPFMDFEGDTFFMDFNPDEKGKEGQIFLVNTAQGADCFEMVEESLVGLLRHRIEHGFKNA